MLFISPQKPFFVLKILEFLSLVFSRVAKLLEVVLYQKCKNFPKKKKCFMFLGTFKYEKVVKEYCFLLTAQSLKLFQ